MLVVLETVSQLDSTTMTSGKTITAENYRFL
jgi:hypothetical protein